jgi:kumamolisin
MKSNENRPQGNPGNRRTAFWVEAVAIAVALAMGLSALAIAGLAPALAGPPSISSSTASPPLTASGPMTSLGIRSELGSTLGGAPDPSAPLPLGHRELVVVTLPFRNAPALSAYLRAVSDPTSPLYDRFLSNAQFAQAFGPAPSDQLGVAHYLESRGLTTVYLSSDRTTVGVMGTLAQLEQAFSVGFSMYRSHGQTFFAPTASPSVPSSLAPWVRNVVGLTNYNFGFRPQLTPNPAVTGPHPLAAAVPGTGVQDYPNEMNAEFQLNQLYNATGNKSAGVHPSFAQGVVVATALWDLNGSLYCPYSLTDIWDFFHGKTGTIPAGMPRQLPAPFDHANYNITGDPGTPPGTGDCTSPAGTGNNLATEELDFEMTIDQEWSGEDAPGAWIEPTYVGGAGVTVTNADISILLSWIAAGNIPNLALVSQSFGGGEGNQWEPYYQEMAAKGVTVLASSGDGNGAGGNQGTQAICDTGGSGQYSWNTEGVPVIDYPGSSPNVLSVGGTANMALAGAKHPSAILTGQTVWNWCPSTDGGVSAGSTGGASSVFTAPSYQTNVPIVDKAMQWAILVTETGNFTNGAPPTGCEGCDDGVVASPSSARVVPDLSGPAAMNTGFMDGSWVTGYGGTSFSSPSVAGMLGSIVAFDGHKLGFFNPTLYSLEQQYLSGGFKGLPFNVAPTYFVQNYSNAFFNGAKDYNASAGWGVPQAYNIALLLGKPFVSTNPHGSAKVGSSYRVTALVKDDQTLAHVEVAFLEPGATAWGTASLALKKGTTHSGSWSGSIPAPTRSGTLEYCVYAVDQAQGNSWSPYNQSAWAATGGANPNFGCTVPFHVTVAGSAAAAAGESLVGPSPASTGAGVPAASGGAVAAWTVGSALVQTPRRE